MCGISIEDGGGGLGYPRYADKAGLIVDLQQMHSHCVAYAHLKGCSILQLVSHMHAHTVCMPVLCA